MQLPPYTKSQKLTIFHLFKFRYLQINHLQQLFNHRDPHRVKQWLQDLENKRYIDLIKNPKDRTKPYIFCLAQRSGHILRKEADIKENSLKWLYKEKSKEKNFIDHHLFLADTCLYFRKNKSKDAKINFFTKQDLLEYNYFPDPLPDSYIDVEEKNQNTRYFLNYFDSETPPSFIRFRLSTYFKYFKSGNWQNNTDNAAFPAILFILHNQRRKNHVDYYGKALLSKSIHDLDIYLTTKDKIKLEEGKENIWQKVD